MAVIVAALLLIVIATQKPTVPSIPGVQFPANFRANFLHYATVERPDGKIRDIYINPEAMAVIKDRGRIPDGTIIVIEGHDIALNPEGETLKDESGQPQLGLPFEMIHVLEKRSNWYDADFTSEHRMGNWNVGSFVESAAERFDEPLSACFNCHRASNSSEFLYSEELIYRYAQTGETVYFFCDLPDRIAC